MTLCRIYKFALYFRIRHTPMNRHWYITEKIISLALIIWGGFLLYLICNFLLFIFTRNSWADLSLIKIFRNFHIMFFLPLATVVAGFLLLFEKKIGWLMALVCSFLNPFIFLIPKDKYSDNDTSIEGILVTVLIAVFCFVAFGILFAKPFRFKYQMTKSNCIAIAAIISVSLLDKLVLYLVS